jgi:hypothetical protein
LILKKLIFLLIFLFLVSAGYAFSGGDGSLGNPYRITTCLELQDMQNDLDANYLLINDINCSETISWNEYSLYPGAFGGFKPVGNCELVDPCVEADVNAFNGSLDGNYHIIKDLYQNWQFDGVGLFGYVDVGHFSNLYFENPKIYGINGVGVLIGFLKTKTTLIKIGVYGASAQITGSTYVGGLIGNGHGDGPSTSDVNNCFNKAQVGWGSEVLVGGLCGYCSRFNFNDSYNTGQIVGSYSLGGITGDCDYVTFRNVYNTGNIGENQNIRSMGGITGTPTQIYIYDSFSTGVINSAYEEYGEIDDSGGLAAKPVISVNISNSYWLYSINSTMNHCYSDASGVLQDTGCTMLEYPNTASYFFDINNEPIINWDFENVWGISSQYNNNLPYLLWQDNNLPTTSLTTCESGIYNSSDKLAFSCADDGGCKEIKVRIQDGNWVTYSSPIELTTDANYKVEYYSIDNSLNTESINEAYCLGDATNPTLTIIPDQNIVTVNATYSITYSGTDERSGIKQYFVSTNGSTFSATSDTNYLFFGSDGDTNILYVKSQDNADNNSSLSIIAITFALTADDNDSDGIADTNDTLKGNNLSVTTTGVTDLNIQVSGNGVSGTYNGLKDVNIYDGNNLMINFDHNFSSTDLNLSRVIITKTSKSIIVDLDGQLQSDQNKTLYLIDNNFISLCVKNAPITTISQISSACTDANEYDFTTCLTSGSYSIAGINCTLINGVIKVSNLRYSGILGTIIVTSSSSTNGSCTPVWSCTSWNKCVDGNQTRTCTKLNNCGTALLGKPTEIRTCVKGITLPDNNVPLIDSTTDTTNSIDVVLPVDSNKMDDSNSSGANIVKNGEGSFDWIILFVLIVIVALSGWFFIIKNNKNQKQKGRN